MAITVDGNNLVFTGTVTVTNFTNPANGVATLVLTPSGGVGTLPALVAGLPGLPPTITLGTVTTLTPGSAATATLTQTATGVTTNSSGTVVPTGSQAAYTLNLSVPQGATGATASYTLGSATDVSGTAANGLVPVVSGTSPTAFTLKSLYNGAAFNPSATFTNIASSGYAQQTMCQVAIPSLPYSYIPLVFAGCTSVGTVNTVISLSATLGSGGSVIASDAGLASTPTQKLRLAPAFGGVLSSGFGKVSTVSGTNGYATAAQTVYVLVNQTVSGISDQWSVAASSMFATVVCLAVSA